MMQILRRMYGHTKLDKIKKRLHSAIGASRTQREAVKWILRYLKGTTKLSLCYGGADPVLEGYTDVDMAGDIDSRKSTLGYIYTFARGVVSWQSRLQKCIALSTTEAEYIAAAEAGKEMLWLKHYLQELGI